VSCGKEPCSTHGELCAFHGDESGRCAFCHRSWYLIPDADSHSCETKGVWGPAERWRVAVAEKMRLEAWNATENPSRADVAPFCPHVGQDPEQAAGCRRQGSSRFALPAYG
jgi:hypothetical protein